MTQTEKQALAVIFGIPLGILVAVAILWMLFQIF